MFPSAKPSLIRRRTCPIRLFRAVVCGYLVMCWWDDGRSSVSLGIGFITLGLVEIAARLDTLIGIQGRRRTDKHS